MTFMKLEKFKKFMTNLSPRLTFFFMLLSTLLFLPLYSLGGSCKDTVLRRVACIGETYCQCTYPKPAPHSHQKGAKKQHEQTYYKLNPSGKSCQTVCYGDNPKKNEKNPLKTEVNSLSTACSLVEDWAKRPSNLNFFEHAKKKCNACRNRVSAEDPFTDEPKVVENQNSNHKGDDGDTSYVIPLFPTHDSGNGKTQEHSESSEANCCTVTQTLPCYQIESNDPSDSEQRNPFQFIFGYDHLFEI